MEYARMVQNFNKKNIKDFQLFVFLNQVWRFKRFLNKFYCIFYKFIFTLDDNINSEHQSMTWK